VEKEPFLIAFRLYSSTSGPPVVYDEARDVSLLLSDSKDPVAVSRHLLTTETKTAQKTEADDHD